jgi:hypothetical protein
MSGTGTGVRGVLHAGLSSPEDCQEAGGEYRFTTDGQQDMSGIWNEGEYFMHTSSSVAWRISTYTIIMSHKLGVSCMCLKIRKL